MITMSGRFRILACLLSLLGFHSIVWGKNRLVAVSSGSRRCSRSQIFLTRSSPSPSGLYLERMVERKKLEVNQLLGIHDKPDDPIFMRMTYMASENKYNVTRSVPHDFNTLIFTSCYPVSALSLVMSIKPFLTHNFQSSEDLGV